MEERGVIEVDKKRWDKKRRVKKNGLKIGLAVVVVMVGIVLGKRYMPTAKTMDLESQYYGMKQEDDGALIVGNHNTGSMVKIEEDGVYLPLEAVQTYVNERFYWDGERLLYTLPEATATYKPGKLLYYVDGTAVACEYPSVIVEEGQVWLDIRLVEQYTNITWHMMDNPKRLWIWNVWDEELTYATVQYPLPVRYRGGPKSPILAPMKKGDVVQVLDTSLKLWTKVQTTDGIIGYLCSFAISDFYKETKTREFESLVYTSLALEEPVSLIWHQNLSDSGLGELPQILEESKVNVIAPSWFTIASEDGQIVSRAESSYVDMAHEAGVFVWAMLDNINIEIDETALLSNTKSRRKLVKNVMEVAMECGVDGINIDLESIGEENGVAFTQLIREFSAACRKEGLILSVDNYVPITSNLYYNRAEQASVVDYIIVMGYDEHWAGGEPGSTASYNFVKNGIVRSLKEVPKEKLILAVPFYTRLWTIDKIGNTVISSKAIAMKDIPNILDQWKVEKQWLEQEHQYYAQLEEEQQIQKLWIEDVDSMRWKLEFAKQYELAGTAIWKANMGSEEVWQLDWIQEQ